MGRTMPQAALRTSLRHTGAALTIIVVAYTALALASDDQVSKMISRVGEEVRANPRMSASDVIRIMKAMETEATATATASVPSSNPGDIESVTNLLEERASYDGTCTSKNTGSNWAWSDTKCSNKCGDSADCHSKCGQKCNTDCQCNGGCVGECDSCAFSDLVLPSNASASGPNCAAGGIVAHGAGCTVSSGSPDHSCSSAQCTDGSWTSPTCFLWKLQNLFTCSTQGSNCASWWGATQRAERGYTAVVDPYDACGQASKMLFPESPYDRDVSPVYDAMCKGYTKQKTGYENGSPSTGTKEVDGHSKPMKYGPQQDLIAFSDTDWLNTGGCDAKAPSCVAGFNYDPTTNLCADSASGWGTTTPASACGYAQHKCDEFKIYYRPTLQTGVLPLTSTNQAAYEGWDYKFTYTFTYVFKKWMECTAKNVTATSSGTAAEPDGWDCEVEKRCVCLSCTMGSKTDTPGDEYYTGEPCSCDAAPESVRGKAGLQCAQT